MTATVEIPGFLAALDAGDRLALGAVADFYDDAGDAARASAWRWLWSAGLEPYRSVVWSPTGRVTRWKWFCTVVSLKGDDWRSNLTTAVYAEVKNSPTRDRRGLASTTFKSRSAAFAAVADALVVVGIPRVGGRHGRS